MGAVTDFGDQIVVTASFTNASGEAANPTTVRWRIKPPAGDEVVITATTDDYALAAPATGTHTITFTPSAPGNWYIRCEGLGAIRQATEDAVFVKPSALTTASIT